MNRPESSTVNKVKNIAVGDKVFLRFGGLGGLNHKTVPEKSRTIPWQVTNVYSNGYFDVECTDQTLPCDPYWAQSLKRSYISVYDIKDGPVDKMRSILALLSD